MSEGGTRFTPAHLADLKAALKLRCETEALDAAAYISGLLVAHDLFADGKARYPTSRHVEASRRRLDRLATAARVVADLLEVEPSARNLLSDEEEWPVASASRLARLVSDLRRVSRRAGETDDLSFRISRWLPPADKAGKLIYVSALWPQLFKMWEDGGHRIAKTADGPLYRFVSLVHVVGNLEKPKASTFREAVETWKRGGAAGGA